MQYSGSCHCGDVSFEFRSQAIEAGKLAHQADPIEPRDMAEPSTPVIGKAFLS